MVAGGTSIPTTDRQGDVSGNGDYNPSSSSPPSNYPNYDYNRWFGGTSAACPFVAGVVALVLSVNPALTVEQVNDIIEKSAQKVRTDLYSYQNQGGRPNGTWNNEMGYGLVDAHQAVVMAQNSECSSSNLTITENVAEGTTSNIQVSNTITVVNNVLNNATANYKAGNRVRLVPGFKAYTGSKFRAHIGVRTSFTPLANKNEEVVEYDIIENDEKVLSVPVSSSNSNWNFNIYPNPSKGKITIDHSFEKGSNYYAHLYDFKGKLILKKEVNGQNSNLELNDFNNGMYIVKIISGDKYFAKKIILNR